MVARRVKSCARLSRTDISKSVSCVQLSLAKTRLATRLGEQIDLDSSSHAFSFSRPPLRVGTPGRVVRLACRARG